MIEGVRKITKLPLDVHLMIENPERYIQEFRQAGSDWITIHVEACAPVQKTLQAIRKLGGKAGVTLCPKTAVKDIEPYFNEVDLVLVMTVEPGFGGQAFMPEMLEKIKYIRSKFSGRISVDGGINAQTGRLAAQAGADVFVAGSYIFKQSDRKRIMDELRTAVTL